MRRDLTSDDAYPVDNIEGDEGAGKVGAAFFDGCSRIADDSCNQVSVVVGAAADLEGGVGVVGGYGRHVDKLSVEGQSPSHSGVCGEGAVKVKGEGEKAIHVVSF